MAVFAKPVNKMPIIKQKDLQKFVEEFNKNVVSNDFLQSCRQTGELFLKKARGNRL